MAEYSVTLLERLRADLGDLDGKHFASTADLTRLLDEFGGDYDTAVWRGLLRKAAAVANVDQYASAVRPEVAQRNFDMAIALARAWGKPAGATPIGNDATLIVGGITKRTAEE